MKKLTFLMPTYNTEKYIEENISTWKELSKIVELIIVEDKETKTADKIAKKIGARYYSKANGNWGSVLNFAKKNKIIKTDYMAVVDPDDTINIDELVILLDRIKDKDLYITALYEMDYKTKKILKRSNINKSISVHEIWVKTNIFNSMPIFKEGIPFMDQHFVLYALDKTTSFEKYNDIAPYNYFLNIAGQTVDTSKFFFKSKEKMKALKEIKSIDKKYFTNNLFKKELEGKKAYTNMIFINYLRDAYDSKSLTKENKKIILQLYKEEKAKTNIPFMRLMIWSKLYRFFTFKIAK